MKTRQMPSSAPWACVGALLLLGACADTPSGQVEEDPLPVDTSRQLCDGSTSLRMAVQGLPGFIKPDGSALWSENGTHFLYVDGTCRYWVRLTASEAVRTGQLDKAREEALMRDSLYQSWAALAGNWPGPRYVYDAGSVYLWDSHYTVACHETCNLPGTPRPLLELLHEDLDSRILRPLWEQGTPVEQGPVRLLLLDGVTWSSSPFSWPLEQPAEDFLYTSDKPPAYGQGLRLDEAEDVRRLRALRAAYEASDERNRTAGKIPVEGPEGHVYGLFMRDALPFEDAQGLVRPPAR